MFHTNDYQMCLWLTLALATVAVIARAFWLYRATLTWPTADGAITALNIERRQDGRGGGHHYCATFSYQFLDPDGHRLSGTWYKNFPTELEACDFAARELPVGKSVVIRFNPKSPCFNELELDSWTCTIDRDRPTALNI